MVGLIVVKGFLRDAELVKMANVQLECFPERLDVVDFHPVLRSHAMNGGRDGGIVVLADRGEEMVDGLVVERAG